MTNQWSESERIRARWGESRRAINLHSDSLHPVQRDYYQLYGISPLFTPFHSSSHHFIPPRPRSFHFTALHSPSIGHIGNYRILSREYLHSARDAFSPMVEGQDQKKCSGCLRRRPFVATSTSPQPSFLLGLRSNTFQNLDPRRTHRLLKPISLCF